MQFVIAILAVCCLHLQVNEVNTLHCLENYLYRFLYRFISLNFLIMLRDTIGLTNVVLRLWNLSLVWLNKSNPITNY